MDRKRTTGKSNRNRPRPGYPELKTFNDFKEGRDESADRRNEGKQVKSSANRKRPGVSSGSAKVKPGRKRKSDSRNVSDKKRRSKASAAKASASRQRQAANRERPQGQKSSSSKASMPREGAKRPAPSGQRPASKKASMSKQGSRAKTRPVSKGRPVLNTAPAAKKVPPKQKKAVNSRKTAAPKKRTKPVNRYYDYYLLVYIIFITAFGIVMLFSISAEDHARKQVIFAISGLIVMIIFSFIPMEFYRSMGGFIFFSSLILMAMVRFTKFGYASHMAKRWLKFGPVTFQPSELAKIGVILLLPDFIVKYLDWTKTIPKENLYKAKIRYIIVSMFIGVVPALFAYKLTDNLSTGIIIGGIYVMIMLVASENPKRLAALFTAGIGFVYFAARKYALKLAVESADLASVSFRKKRIISWVNPYKFIRTTGWQVVQGLYAIGSGGLLGKGLGNSTQKLYNIPEAQNDFIFAIICEELGIVGAMIVIITFILIINRLMHISQLAKDTYSTLVTFGIMSHIAIQVILNICVILNIIPTTGVSMPLISYGGTAMLILMGELGIALSAAHEIELE